MDTPHTQLAAGDGESPGGRIPPPPPKPKHPPDPTGPTTDSGEHNPETQSSVFEPEPSVIKPKF